MVAKEQMGSIPKFVFGIRSPGSVVLVCARTQLDIVKVTLLDINHVSMETYRKKVLEVGFNSDG